MIIASPGIPGNPPTGLFLIVLRRGFRRKWMCRVVAEQTDDNASDPRQGALRVGSPRIRKIFHLAAVSASEPFRGLRQFWKSFCASHTAAVETYGFRPFDNPLCIRGVIHAADRGCTRTRNKQSLKLARRNRNQSKLRTAVPSSVYTSKTVNNFVICRRSRTFFVRCSNFKFPFRFFTAVKPLTSSPIPELSM